MGLLAAVTDKGDPGRSSSKNGRMLGEALEGKSLSATTPAGAGGVGNDGELVPIEAEGSVRGDRDPLAELPNRRVTLCLMLRLSGL